MLGIIYGIAFIILIIGISEIPIKPGHIDGKTDQQTDDEYKTLMLHSNSFLCIMIGTGILITFAPISYYIYREGLNSSIQVAPIYIDVSVQTESIQVLISNISHKVVKPEPVGPTIERIPAYVPRHVNFSV